MRIYLVIIITFVALINIDCERQTKLFKNIEVQGRLVNFYTKEPIPNSIVKLKANNVHSSSSYSEAAILLDTYTTNNDGSFILKSKASKGENYYLQLDTDDHIYSYSSTDTFFSSQPNKIVQLGDIYFGEHLYRFKIRFVPTSGNCAWWYDQDQYQNQQFTKINSGIDTVIMFNKSLSYYMLRENKNVFNYNYKTGSCVNPTSANFASKVLQITSADTILLNINY
jgi:hypothetical protein